MNFIPRTECPKADNQWYCRKGHGGESPCIPGKPEKWPGSVLANCVGYAYGRVAEILGEFIKIGFSYGVKPYSAQNWWAAKDGLARGQIPALGAVACWTKADKSMGHVAVVEKIYSDGSWQSSESAYNGSAWKTRKYPRTSYRAGFKFQGFIYLPDRPTPIPHDPTEHLSIGNTVKIIGPGYSNSMGGIRTTAPIGWTRTILGFREGARYPYRVGSGNITTAWFPAASLKEDKK